MAERPGSGDGVEPPSAAPGSGGRPRLPDPQQDRHVAFPELTPSPKDPPEASRPSSPRPPPPALPPDAWARQDLTSPPTVPSPERRRRTWLPWAAVVGVLIVLGGTNIGHDESVTMSGDSGTYVQPMDPPAYVPVDGYVVRVTDPQVAPPLPETTAVVGHSIPPATAMLRVEVSTADPRSVRTQVTTSTGLDDTSVDTAPSAVEVHFSAGGTHQLDVSLSDMSGDRPEPVQCRIYLGHSLLAIGTGTGSTTCSISW